LTEFEFGKELKAREIKEIPGMVEFDLPVHGDNRGWFKENWQREKMTKLGLQNDFTPVQNSISFNEKRGTTRGLHAEPWDKFISIVQGEVFGVWVDLREGVTFGNVYTANIDPSKAFFVPRGVANGFQTLVDDTSYTYLVNDHWSPNGEYTSVNLADDTLKINWPIDLTEAEISDKDKNNPQLDDITPIRPKKVMITGANGQLGSALKKLYPDAVCIDRSEFDLTDWSQYSNYNWRDYDLILNAAAYTNVDGAETDDGRRDAWNANVTAVKNLTKIARENNLTLVHISSDYVFDGEKEIYDENELYAPLGVYGQTKAAADEVVATLEKFYILRTSWVIGGGKNFVRTMFELAKKGVKPKVVNDQIGRLTFTDELARGIKYLLDERAPFGIYNLTGDGESVCWDEIAREVYELSGNNRDDVTGISTKEYFADADIKISPRPHFSTLDLTKIKNIGFVPNDWRESLKKYMTKING